MYSNHEVFGKKQTKNENYVGNLYKKIYNSTTILPLLILLCYNTKYYYNFLNRKVT
jgi:hypothetical protein